MNRADGQKTTLVVRGQTIEAALEQARSQLGVRDIKVLNASRMRRGGVAGFFAKDLGVELEVTAEDDARPITSERRTALVNAARTGTGSVLNEPEYLRDAATEIAAATDADRGVADLSRPAWAQVSRHVDEPSLQDELVRSLTSNETGNPVVDATALAVRGTAQETTKADTAFTAVLEEQLDSTAAEFGGEEDLDITVFSTNAGIAPQVNLEHEVIGDSNDEDAAHPRQRVSSVYDRASEVSHAVATDPEDDALYSPFSQLEVDSETLKALFDNTLVRDQDGALVSTVADSAPVSPASVTPTPVHPAAAAPDQLSKATTVPSDDSTLVTYSLDIDEHPSSNQAAPTQENHTTVAPIVKRYIKPLQTPSASPPESSLIKAAETAPTKPASESAREEFARRVKAIAAEYMFEDLGDDLSIQRVIDSALPLQPVFSTQPTDAGMPFSALPDSLLNEGMETHVPAETTSTTAQPRVSIQPDRPSQVPAAEIPSISGLGKPSTTFSSQAPSTPAPFSLTSQGAATDKQHLVCPLDTAPGMTTPAEESPRTVAPADLERSHQDGQELELMMSPAPAQTTSSHSGMAPAFDEEAELAAQLAASRAISDAIAEQLFSGLKTSNEPPAPAAPIPPFTAITPVAENKPFGGTPQPAVFSPVELEPLAGLDALSDAVISYVRPRPGQPEMTGINETLAGAPTSTSLNTDAGKPRFEADVQAWLASRNLRRVTVETEAATKNVPAQSSVHPSPEPPQIPAWRVDTWKASREARDAQPVLQTRVAPSPQVISRLISLGVPHSVIAGLHDGLALREALSVVKTIDPSNASITLVIGRADLARKWAGGIARVNGVQENDVVVVSSTPGAGELSTVEHIQEWRMQQLGSTSVVAISLHAPSTNIRMVSRMVEATRADVVRLVVDANDTRTIEMWSQIAPGAVLDVVGMSRAERPGALLALGMPIATVDGAPATPESLALTLLEHSSR